MNTHLFDIIKRNLAVPDSDRDPAAKTMNERPLKENTIAGIQMVHRLMRERQICRAEAARIAAAETGCVAQTLKAKWRDYEARLKRDGLL